MKPGSVTVDLAAENGGNVATTVKGQVITTPKGVTCVGYTDLPSRLASQASALYSNNASKFLLSMGPFTGYQGHFYLDEHDAAVRQAAVCVHGDIVWPAPPLELPKPPAPRKTAEAALKAVKSPFQQTLATAMSLSAGLLALLACGVASPGAAFTSSIAKFGLASICGYQTVR